MSSGYPPLNIGVTLDINNRQVKNMQYGSIL